MEAINGTKKAIGKCREDEQRYGEACYTAQQGVLIAKSKRESLSRLLLQQVNAPIADGTDVTERIPDDLLEMILSYLSMVDQRRTCSVSKRWQTAVERILRRNWSELDLRFAKYTAGAPFPMVLDTADLQALAVPASGLLIYTGSADGCVRVWSTTDGAQLSMMPPPVRYANYYNNGHYGTGVSALALSPCGRVLYSGYSGPFEGGLHAWTLPEVHRGNGVVPNVSLRLSLFRTAGADARDDAPKVLLRTKKGYLYAGLRDGSVHMWALAGLEHVKLRVMHGKRGAIGALAVNEVCTDHIQVLYAGAEDGSIGIWSTTEGTMLLVLELMKGAGPRRCINALVLSVDGLWLYAGAGDGNLVVWSTMTGTTHGMLKGHTNCVTALALSNDGARLYSGSRDCTVRVWPLEHSTKGVSDAIPVLGHSGILKHHDQCVLKVVLSEGLDGKGNQTLFSGTGGRKGEGAVRVC